MAKKAEASKMVAARSKLDAASRKRFDAVRDVIAAHGDGLKKRPGVLKVRPGYLFRDGWITREPAVVVVVDPRVAVARGDGKAQIPDAIDGVPVDVAEASPAEQLLADQGAEAGTRSMVTLPASSAPDLALPDWERAEGSEGTRGLDDVGAMRRPGVPYRPPAGVKLGPVSGNITITCHSSPDAGWTTLGPFLAGVRRTLTVAMYDFTAPHILEGLSAGMKKSKGVLKLNLDPGIALAAGGGARDPNNPKARDVTEDQVRDALKEALGDKFDFTWAAVKRAGKTTDGIFPSAYHIKVAVRDSSAFWLSSGNWQSSNQPDIKRPTDAAGIKKVFSQFNREWHVLVDNAQLAKIYEAFIENDIEEATPLQDTSGSRALEPTPPDLLVPIDELDAVPRGALKFFDPQVFKFDARKKVKIQPVLTPDNFVDVILPLIESATKTLSFQNQYIHINRQNAEGFMKLVGALLKKIRDGLDVRIILRDIGDTRGMLEALQAQGFPAQTIRLQAGCHNKGIIVDGKVVAVGSHNWSSDGTTANRDATLVIHSPDVAAFYQQIFDFDWANLAHQKVARERQILVAPRGLQKKDIPKGMMRIPWKSYFEE